jgi:sigma-B regulation protein RsbU (phosphoserine phosphatase)
MSEDRERAAGAGCDDYETKPIDLPRLLGKIAAQLNTSVKTNPDAEPKSTRPSEVAISTVRHQLAPTTEGTEGRVLVVDDTPDNRVILARRLARAGYAVESAADGIEALRRVRDEPFDLIVLDVMMPGMSGFEVLDELRRTFPATDLPVIMATARDASEDVVKAFDHGANDYVTKPLDFAVVLARVQTQIALKRAIDHVRALERDLAIRNRDLQTANARMKSDLDAASKVQAALLPSASPPVPGYAFAWLFSPSAELAGDIFNVFRLDDRHVGLYVLDVSGHGVAAALLSVTVSRFLFPMPDPTSLLWERSDDGDVRLAPPARVAQRLGERFPFDTTTSQYFTLVYGILDLHEHRLRYVSAGHPQIVRHPRGEEPMLLEAAGFPVGVTPVGAEADYEENVVDLAPGDRLFIYSDGIPETMSPDGELFGCTRMMQAICTNGDGTNGEPCSESDSGAGRCLALLSDALRNWSGLERCQDDQTALCVERRI